MAVTEKILEGARVLVCDECPDKPNYSAPVERLFAMSWNKSCYHIETEIMDYSDPSLNGGQVYKFNLSPVGSFLCLDPWSLWIEVNLGTHQADLGDMMEVQLAYESDFYSNTKAVIGTIMPEDRREVIRGMVWDWLTVELLKRQPTADSGGFRCPNRIHERLDQADKVLFVSHCSERETLNAEIACVVLEGCCTICYKQTMGQDVTSGNFGMAGVAQGSRPRRSGPPPQQPLFPSTLPSTRPATQRPATAPAASPAAGPGKSPAGNTPAPPPWER